jgi:hypothetical protein
MEMKKTNSTSFAWFFVGLLVGGAIATGSFRVVELIDYDSGKIRLKSQVLLITVRQTDEATNFANILLPTGRSSLKGITDWRTVAVYRLNSKRSATYESGASAAAVRTTEALFQHIIPAERANVKLRLLNAMNEGNTTEVKRIIADLPLSVGNQ